MINKNQYNELCEMCSKVLSFSDTNLTRMAIPWIHVIRICPAANNRYKSIFYLENFFKRKLIFFKNKFKQKVLNIFFLIKALNHKNKYWEGLDLKDSDIDFLFISHALNKDQLKKDYDFYFGNIPEKLKQKGYKVLLIHICHFTSNSFSSKVNLKNPFFIQLLSFKEELSILKMMNNESKILNKLYKKEDNIILKRILKKASFEVKSIGTRNNLRLSIQIKNILKIIRPKSIITTYEGHANEKIIFSSAKEAFPKIKCIAYQHTGSFESSNSIYRLYNSKFNPDFILTSGENDLISFKNKLNSNYNNKIKLLGSTRGNLNTDKFDSSLNKSYSCLVIPEAFLSEIVKLFSFSLECANKHPNIKFIWRLHPSISFTQVFKKAPYLKNIPHNITLSVRKIEDDIKISKWCLYRGSTAIFKSISAGLRPLFLVNYNNEIIIDPLNKMKKKNISSIDDLASVINFDVMDKYVKLSKKRSYYINFCNSRFSKININVFDEII